ncbi:MAG: N-acetyltransferase family protein [Actinomycetota bacterium]|nr:N-acetyltransferase family protein [Actinomycetota bacterium]
MLIRPADTDTGDDAAACAAIYEPFVNHSAVSFELVPPDRAELYRRIEQNSASHAWLVAQDDGQVAGFAYGGPHRARAAYRWATEVSVYVHPEHHRRGVGRALYGELLPLLARHGLHVALAGITLPNPASVALHEGIGFQPVGVYRRVGWKAGAWHDVAWWQLELVPAGTGAPPEPGPPVSPD